MDMLAPNQHAQFDFGCCLNGWRLQPELISENEIPIILWHCEKSHRVELAIWLLGVLPKSCCRIIENQIDMLVLEELRNPTATEISFIRDWAVKRKLVLDTDKLIQTVKKQGVIGLSHQSNLWVIHPSAKRPKYWQTTHYDLISYRMTGDTLHASLELLFHCSGASIHPRSQIMKKDDVEKSLWLCHDIHE